MTEPIIVVQEKEQWSWLKFVKGFFDGKNYAKAIVLGICGLVVLVVVFSTFKFIRSVFVKDKPMPTQTVGTNTGSISTTNKDNREDGGFKLIDLSKWFSSK